MHRTAPAAARISSIMVFSFVLFELSRAPVTGGAAGCLLAESVYDLTEDETQERGERNGREHEPEHAGITFGHAAPPSCSRRFASSQIRCLASHSALGMSITGPSTVISIFIFRLKRRRLARLICCSCLRPPPAHYHGEGATGNPCPPLRGQGSGFRVQGSGFRVQIATGTLNTVPNG